MNDELANTPQTVKRPVSICTGSPTCLRMASASTCPSTTAFSVALVGQRPLTNCRWSQRNECSGQPEMKAKGMSSTPVTSMKSPATSCTWGSVRTSSATLSLNDSGRGLSPENLATTASVPRAAKTRCQLRSNPAAMLVIDTTAATPIAMPTIVRRLRTGRCSRFFATMATRSMMQRSLLGSIRDHEAVQQLHDAARVHRHRGIMRHHDHRGPFREVNRASLSALDVPTIFLQLHERVSVVEVRVLETDQHIDAVLEAHRTAPFGR